MTLDDTISEFIGALAMMMVTNESGSLGKDDFNEILKITKIETSKGEDYKRPHSLVEKATEYWEAADRSTVVNSINCTLPIAQW